MKFRTEIHIETSNRKLGYQTPMMFNGPCFTEYMSAQLMKGRLPLLSNPFGVLYNPVSVAHSLRLLMGSKKVTGADLVQHDRLWHSFFHHSRFSRPDKKELSQLIKNNCREAGVFLKKARFLFITWGTARVWVYNETGRVVSNCHKIPAIQFTRELLEPDEITALYRELIRELKTFNPQLEIVFTISPVRHWKDGAHGNQVSKSVLHLALQRLLQKEDVSYFPSYELLLDDLRDYRYYADDLIHPSESAIEYIWDKFSSVYMEADTRQLFREVEKVTKAAQHRPQTADTEGLKTFAGQMLRTIEKLTKLHPGLDLSEEESHFSELIK